ncbi:hypothetical protein ACFPDQ_05780 [Pseudofrancisella aestuarii]|uniref:Phage holin family protein n=1 Tax=Pseudofrancisella aestuarii TaxID=2670347 RepID=A0ABV9TE56_9GAMM|nr:hypothetical protein [Pseudofrancisella aestuarii]
MKKIIMNEENKETQLQQNNKEISKKKLSLYSCKKSLGNLFLVMILSVFCIAEIIILALIFFLFLSFYIAIIIAGTITILSIFIMKGIKKYKEKKSVSQNKNNENIEEITEKTTSQD